MINRRNFIKGAVAGFFALNFFPEKVFSAENLSVKTRYGTFNGFLDKNGVKTWLGIPYAQPPVKKFRWQAPQKLNPSNKTFDAKKFGFTAVQVIDPTEVASKNPQSEDCLTLNIWKKSSKKNLPVMVFIPGGGFQVGGTSDPLYNGGNFAAENDVIIVTINYRLNVFGFMNFAEIDKNFSDSGYLGMKDQIAALTWVKENISEFGGNPENITIFGESAGSISAMLLTVTPAAKNLFQKAIAQSGHSLAYSTPERSAQLAEIFMKNIGAKNIGDLMKKSAGEIRNTCTKFIDTRLEIEKDYFPTCDGKFLPKNPFKALNNGDARGIKILTGTTSDEWRYWFLYSDDYFKIFREHPGELSLALDNYNLQNVEKIYKNWLKNRADDEENFIEFLNQVDWRVGQEICAEYYSKFNEVYFYLFSQKSPVENLRSCHAVDLPFVFNNSDEIYPNPEENLAKIIQKSWAAFATTGNPNNEFIPHWEKYSAENRQTLEINSEKCILHKDLNTENLNELRYIYEN